MLDATTSFGWLTPLHSKLNPDQTKVFSPVMVHIEETKSRKIIPWHGQYILPEQMWIGSWFIFPSYFWQWTRSITWRHPHLLPTTCTIPSKHSRPTLLALWTCSVSTWSLSTPLHAAFVSLTVSWHLALWWGIMATSSEEPHPMMRSLLVPLTTSPSGGARGHPSCVIK